MLCFDVGKVFLVSSWLFLEFAKAEEEYDPSFDSQENSKRFRFFEVWLPSVKTSVRLKRFLCAIGSVGLVSSFAVKRLNDFKQFERV